MMYTTLVFSMLLAAASAGRDTPVTAAVSKKTGELVNDPFIVDTVNADPKSKWKAGHNKHFDGWLREEARKLLGTKLDAPVGQSIPKKSYEDIPNDSIPESFDARKQWPNYIHPIRNQERCGSCWAFAATEALSDRLAIATQGKTNVVLSPEDLVSCDMTDNGCGGGYLANAWKYLEKTGVVTDGCFPYGAGAGKPTSCTHSCVDGETYTKYKTTDTFQLETEEDIQKAIMTDGPVEAGFTVYKSFMSYQSGVYERHWWKVWDTVEGGHAVKIVGWGVENDTEYWIIANSWSTQWGEDGFFRILRGKNECGIGTSGQVALNYKQRHGKQTTRTNLTILSHLTHTREPSFRRPRRRALGEGRHQRGVDW